MSRRPARATQADIRRAIEAAKAAGVAMAVEIRPDGSIRLIPVTPDMTKSVAPPLGDRPPMVF